MQAAWQADANMAINNSLFTTALFTYQNKRLAKNAAKLYSHANEIPFDNLNLPKIYTKHTLQVFLLAGIFILNTAFFIPPINTNKFTPQKNTISRRHKTTSPLNSNLFLRQVNSIKNKLWKTVNPRTKEAINSQIRRNILENTYLKTGKNEAATLTNPAKEKYARTSVSDSANTDPHDQTYQPAEPHEVKNPSSGKEPSFMRDKKNSSMNGTVSKSASRATRISNKKEMHNATTPSMIQIDLSKDGRNNFYNQLSKQSLPLRTFSIRSRHTQLSTLEIGSVISDKTLLSHLSPSEREFLSNYIHSSH